MVFFQDFKAPVWAREASSDAAPVTEWSACLGMVTVTSVMGHPPGGGLWCDRNEPTVAERL
jgi:hypothetical protein